MNNLLLFLGIAFERRVIGSPIQVEVYAMGRARCDHNIGDARRTHVVQHALEVTSAPVAKLV